MRPRIRTVKPEMWADEKVGSLSREARLLLVGLVTMADDEGRFRARRSQILGSVFPDDDDAHGLVDGWIAEIKEAAIVVFYVSDGTPYGAFRHWRRHQKVNRPTPSDLPPPPEPKVVRENRIKRTDSSLNSHGGIGEGSMSAHSSRAFRSDTDPVVVVFEYWQQRCGKARAKLTDERRRHVAARLDASPDQRYSVEDIKLGIDGAALNPPTDRETGVVHDDLVSICRNGSQLERYMARAAAKPSATVVPINGRRESPSDLINAIRGEAS